MSRYAEYATTAELKNYMNKSSADDDTVLDALLDAAGLAIDNFCNRPDGFLALAAATARYYPGSGKYYQWIDECVEVTAVAMKDSSTDDEDEYTALTVGTVGTTTEADVFPATGDTKYPNFTRTPYTFLLMGVNGDYSSFTYGRSLHKPGFRKEPTDKPVVVPTVEVTAKWGYATEVPDAIKTATMMQAARWYKEFEGAMNDALASGELGTILYRQELHPDVKFLLVAGRYVRPAVGRD
jgi:hypothetical protein